MENNKQTLKEYENYYSLHNEYNGISEEVLADKIFNFSKNFSSMKLMDKNIRILDIGCGDGSFAKFCKKLGFKNYQGVDVCSEVITANKKEYPSYIFECIDINDFFSKNNQQFDIIFMSHVLEHFEIELGRKLINEIYLHLSGGSLFLNIMPNASALFFASMTRYNDITHKTLYTETSFGQIANSIGFKKIDHLNKYIGQNLFKRMIHLIAIKIFRITIMMSGFSFPRIYTNEIITIAKK